MAKPVVPAASVETEVTAEVEPASPLTIVQNDETREMFSECKAGDQKWVLLQIDSHDDATITATPLEVEYEEEVEEAEPAGVPKAIGKVAKGGY